MWQRTSVIKEKLLIPQNTTIITTEIPNTIFQLIIGLVKACGIDYIMVRVLSIRRSVNRASV